ncbi:hypothetical protein HK102_000722 [Quaeritorhiza haematococci]|nr:hypothetical protein HK102_000722 [Quaeritorhiza haematococci]
MLQAWSSGLPHLRGYVFSSMSELALHTVLRRRLMENEKLLQILLESFNLYGQGDVDNFTVKGTKDMDSLPLEVADVFLIDFNLEKVIKTFVSRCSHPASKLRICAFGLFEVLAARDLGQDILRENKKAVDMMAGYLRSPRFRVRLKSSKYILRLISSNPEALAVARLPKNGFQRGLTKLPPQLAEIVEANPHSVHRTLRQNTADYTCFVDMLRKSTDYNAAGSIASRIIQTTKLGFLNTKFDCNSVVGRP